MSDLPARARAVVVTVSDRSYAGERTDTSGPLAAELLAELGFAVGPVVLIDDDADRVADAVRDAVRGGADLVITTGGTGIGRRDVTPEAMDGVFEREVAGIAEAIRAYSSETVPTAVLSRGRAGVAARTLVVNLPGSPGGVRDGVSVLRPVIGHAIAQLRGADDHPSPS